MKLIHFIKKKLKGCVKHYDEGGIHYSDKWGYSRTDNPSIILDSTNILKFKDSSSDK